MKNLKNFCLLILFVLGFLLLSDSFAYEQGEGIWDNIWMRQEGMVTLGSGPKSHDNSPSLVITSRSAKDWSLGHKKLIEVRPGEVYSFSGLVKTSGKEAVGELSVVLYDANRHEKQWQFAMESVSGAENWQKVKRQFIVPFGIKYIRFRLTGSGEGKTWFNEVEFKKERKNIFIDQSVWSLENSYLTFTFDTLKGQWTLEDKRSSKKWEASFATTDFLVTKVTKDALQLGLEIADPQTMDSFNTVIALAQDTPEISFSIDNDPGTKLKSLEFPPALEITQNDKIVLPLAEGFLFDFQTAVRLIPQGLHYKGGWPLAFVGVLDGESGWMEIIETPVDFELDKDDLEGGMSLKNRWLSQKGKFGYKRKMRYVFFDKGGYVAMAKCYREYIKEKGLFKTLSEKDTARKNNISKLVGAVDVWYWDNSKGDFAKELYKAGIKKVLFSNADWDVQTINGLGYLTGIYDIYQDVWPPIYHNVIDQHEGWPQDLVLDVKGDWIKGWTIKKDLKEYPGGVICSICGLEKAKKNIPQELKKKPYTARFIDTTTASPWRECYNPRHPTTRSEDLKYRMALLDFCSNELGLVTGSEDGVDVAAPFTDYFEGMMSPGFARLPESGRMVAAVKYISPTDDFLNYLVGTEYRIPLWELVFHDSIVATWYWGDSSNRIPEVWWRKDLFNILYGNMPLWAIRDWDHWKELKPRFIASYQNINPVFEKVGWAQMLTHRFVTEDHTVQETTFSNAVRIVVNFSDKEYFLAADNYTLPSKGFVVFEKGKIWKDGKY